MSRTRRPSLKRLLGNAALAVAVILALVVWFDRHLLPYVSASFYVGSTLSLLVLAQVAVAMWTYFFPSKEQESLPDWILVQPWLTKVLGVALALAVILNLVTSSIWINHGNEDESVNRVTVQVRAGEEVPYTFSATARRPVAGRAFFFRFRSQDFGLVVEEPRGYEPIPPRRFGLGSRIYLDFPADFTPKQYHLVRLVGLPVLMQQLPPHGGEALARYRLEMIRGREAPINLGAMCRQVTFVGAPEEDLMRLLAGMEPERYQNDDLQLLTAQGMEAGERQLVASRWAESHQARYGSIEFQPNDHIIFRIVREDPDKVIGQCEIQIKAAHEISTLLFKPVPP